MGVFYSISSLSVASQINPTEQSIQKPIVLKTMEDRTNFINSLWQTNQTPDGLSELDIKRIKSINLNQFPHASSIKLALLKSLLDIEISTEEVIYLNNPSAWSEESLQVYDELSEDFDNAHFKLAQPRESSNEEYRKALRTNDTWSKNEIQELLDFQPKWRFGNNDYRKVTRLYVFCRQSREYPCLMVMKDQDGNLTRDANGEVWNQRKLALSGRGLTYDQTNGNTPQGIFTINSVMPTADKKFVYGKFRRIKLDFVKKSRNEKDLLQYIPDDLQRLNWWKESVVARDKGRNLFRIHGVGRKNLFRSTTYYPFIPTAGCIASVEGKYNGVTYSDQRELLDQFMVSMGLNPVYENETAIKGMLYVVNIDDEQRAVELEDIL